LHVSRPSLFARRAPAAHRGARRTGESGQGLVEFALTLPIFVLLLMGLIEFSLAFNAVLNVNYASRNAALLAAEAGNAAGADCVVLQAVDDDIAPATVDAAIESVDIYWADADGTQKAGKVNHYTRGGTTACTYSDGTTLTVPYTLATAGYVDSSRCSAIKGCGSSHPGLDNVGVTITYRHAWRTPMSAFIGGTGSGFTIVKSNATRMEPIL
jgi:Flp pilus assembly protein TadG